MPLEFKTSRFGFSPLNDPSPNWSHRPLKETILLDGCDYEHLLVVMEFANDPKPSEDEMANSFVKTLALVLRRKMNEISSTARKHSLKVLLGLLQEDDKNVMIAVAQGVVPVLVRLMDSSSVEMKEKTVAAISRVSMVDSSKHILIAEGLLLLNHLLRVLDSRSGFAKEKACVALQALSFSKENARAIGCRCGISSLLEIYQGGTPGCQASAAGVLRNLASFPEIKENFGKWGCGPFGEGGIECLKNFWDSAPSVQSLEVAIDLLRHLASFSPVAEVLCSDGFIPRLGEKEMGECGCINLLIKMLDGKAVAEKEVAAKALSNLLLYTGNRKMFEKDEKGIVSAIQLLDPSI
ncbi:hypothetical protein G4B88_002302 [Cannabis sativa]|uniref:Uncharacterized protein n=1 Tax=Cannabis sativa TaxID=3483 RepID=A0A7J6EUQ6_CANSA|nr:hypothetical protein G4B88_002302 [Cannabis sativa]